MDCTTVWYRAGAVLILRVDGDTFEVTGSNRDALENSLRGIVSQDESECIIRRYVDSLFAEDDEED